MPSVMCLIISDRWYRYRHINGHNNKHVLNGWLKWSPNNIARANHWPCWLVKTKNNKTWYQSLSLKRTRQMYQQRSKWRVFNRFIKLMSVGMVGAMSKCESWFGVCVNMLRFCGSFILCGVKFNLFWWEWEMMSCIRRRSWLGNYLLIYLLLIGE